MYYVSEQSVVDSVLQPEVTAAVESMFAALAQRRARNFDVVREELGYADAIFGFKSGFDSNGPLLGVKAGGFWPGNAERALANHQSTVLLFDPDTGRPQALVRATHLTSLRTAAASAVSIRHLARADSSTLGILGAGGQAEFQVRAALPQRRFRRLLIADRDESQSTKLAENLRDLDLEIETAPARRMVEEADVLITVTPSFEPTVKAAWVRPGTHIACMGADTLGKHEVETVLVADARLYGDEPEQAVTIGECQHAYAAGLIAADSIVCIGKVVLGEDAGRRDDEEITLFDSTGIGLQDLVAARLALELGIRSGAATVLE